MSTTEFAHLHFHSPFSFLDGAAPLETALTEAGKMGLTAIALTDHDNVSGAVLFQRLAAAAGVKPIQGAEVTLRECEGTHHLTLLATGPEGYATLCRLLTRSHLENERLKPALAWSALEAVVGQSSAHGLIALSGCRRGEIPSLLWAGRNEEAYQAAGRYRDLFGRDNFALEVQRDFLPGSARIERGLRDIAGRFDLRLVATNNVHYLDQDDFWVHDLLTCARTLTTVEDVHPERRLNAENWLKPPPVMARLFADFPAAGRGALEVAERCEPALVPGRRLHPAYPLPPGEESAAAYLRKVVLAGATRRYGKVTRQAGRRLESELHVICGLGYEDYFLLVWDLCAHARRRGVRFAGRGSAADSAVAYCLGITNVDAIARGLLFERFMSLERGEKPDIDVDFDARRRDEVAAYLTDRYGAERVASVCTYNTFHARSAVRDLGKALGIPPAELDALAKRLPYARADAIPEVVGRLPELRDSGLPFWKFERLFAAGARVAGFPRHLGTHLGGVVVGRDPLTAVTPLQRAAKGVVVCQFDKEYVEDLGLIKLDLLSLRTLSAVEDAVADLTRVGTRAPESGLPAFDYDAIPPGDRDTMAMIRKGETVGVFQLESPAQRALQARLGATGYEDLVASVALIRPGPIKGNMVEPFIARRQGREPVTYLHPLLEPILKKTYGVILYQEQVIEVAVAVAGFGPGEADRLRRVMTHHRHGPEMEAIGRLFVDRAVARAVDGLDRGTAEAIFACMEGYASYGFCEAHAAAFADTAYRTAYLARHHPAEFFAALLSQQPMGYYPPGTLCVEAGRRGVPVHPPDINRSEDRYTVERVSGSPDLAPGGPDRIIRVSLRQVKGMEERALKAILEARQRDGPFRGLGDFCRRCCPPATRGVVEALVLSGACDGLDPERNRRRLFWRLPLALKVDRGAPTGFTAAATPALVDEIDRVGGDAAGGRDTAGAIADFSCQEKLRFEYDLLGFAPGRHLLEYLRPGLTTAGFTSSAGLRRMPSGRQVRIAGLPVRPHRPPVRSGRTIVFLSLEDEAGLADVTVFEQVYQRYGRLLFTDPCPPLAVEGKTERRGKTVTVIARRCYPLSEVRLGSVGPR